MALYLGGEKVKLNLDGVTYYLNVFSETTIINGIRLLSSDGYVLTDSNGLYLTTKEDE
jgi:hypothetical protein